MPLLERVSTLLRANLNDLVDRAEDPEKLLKQVLLDMQNQLLQVKTQVAIAIADQHMLEKKQEECKRAAETWRSKAETAVRQNDDALARAAIERCLAQEQIAENLTAQIADQRTEADAMRDSYRRLQSKLAETEAEGEALLMQRRRARNARLPDASVTGAEVEKRLKQLRVQAQRTEAENSAIRLLDTEDAVEGRLLRMQREERVERLLAELKMPSKMLPG